MVAASGDAIIGKAADGSVTDWNRGAEALYGYAAAEIIGRPISALLPPGHEDDTMQILDRLRHGERVEHHETRRRRKNGDIIDVSLTASPLWDAAGRLLGASVVARDITAAKRAQLALEEREAHLRSVLETVPDAMIVIDSKGIMRSFSTTAERLFGYTGGGDHRPERLHADAVAVSRAARRLSGALLRHRRAPHHRPRPRRRRAAQGRAPPSRWNCGSAR